jgi:hypothetical protein
MPEAARQKDFLSTGRHGVIVDLVVVLSKLVEMWCQWYRDTSSGGGGGRGATSLAEHACHRRCSQIT